MRNPLLNTLSHQPAAVRHLALALVLGSTTLASAQAQNFPITAGQRATANQVAQAGVPLSDLAENAPDEYTVKRGDTLWAISGLFLKQPWRWPELWGMNLEDIRNPHLIFPGQQLFLDKTGGRALLRTRAADNAPPTVRVSPRTRFETLAETALSTLPMNAIEPFLAEPLIIEEAEMLKAPRVVGAREGRVLLASGDRGYARGSAEMPLEVKSGAPRNYRVFRNAVPMRDPDNGTVLGFEAQFVGRAELVRGESSKEVADKDGKQVSQIEPATIDIKSTREEVRIGDRLLPEPPRELFSLSPRAPTQAVQARVVSIYGSAVANASQNQIVLINRGKRDGVEAGQVLAIQRDGETIVDRTDPQKAAIKLPNERNGLLMVFRPFEKMSYGLVLDITDTVKVGDRLTNPR